MGWLPRRGGRRGWSDDGWQQQQDSGRDEGASRRVVGIRLVSFGCTHRLTDQTGRGRHITVVGRRTPSQPLDCLVARGYEQRQSEQTRLQWVPAPYRWETHSQCHEATVLPKATP